MYNVSHQKHDRYGDIINVCLSEDGEYESPFKAFEKIKQIKRILSEKGISKTRILVIDEILTIKQTEKWAAEQYKELPKCYSCVAILNDDVFTHALKEDVLFCSKKCSDADYFWELEKLNDEEDIDL